MNSAKPTATSAALNGKKQGDKYGSGYIRIREELKVYPELTFTVEENSGGILACFCQREGVSELYRYIRETPGVRIPELSQQHHVPIETLERWIKQLRHERRRL